MASLMGGEEYRLVVATGSVAEKVGRVGELLSGVGADTRLWWYGTNMDVSGLGIVR